MIAARAIAVGCALALVVAAAAPPRGAPGGSTARAWAISVVVPGQPGAATRVLAAPPGAFAARRRLRVPGRRLRRRRPLGDDERVRNGRRLGRRGRIVVVASLSLFGGEITAASVTGEAHARATPDGGSGDTGTTSISRLVVLGHAVTPAANRQIPLGDWGYAITLEQRGEPSTQPVPAYHGFVIALDVTLTAAHGGLPAGSELQIGYAEANAQAGARAPLPAAPSAPRRRPSRAAPGSRRCSPRRRASRRSFGGAATSSRSTARRRSSTPSERSAATSPAAGTTATTSSPRSALPSSPSPTGSSSPSAGTPSAAGASGSATRRGTSSTTRISPRTRRSPWTARSCGPETCSASSATPATRKGRRRTSTSRSTRSALLGRGYDGAVDPTSYLDGWRRAPQDVRFEAAADRTASARPSGIAPRPGAILLGQTDISTASGLDPRSLRRALTSPLTEGEGGLLLPRLQPPASRAPVQGVASSSRSSRSPGT